MKPIILIIALTVSAHAQTSTFFGANPRDTPQAVPEPSSPLVMLVSAGLALLGRRHRKGCIRERRVDMRTVEYR
jgi:hypothetical protein